MSFNSIALALLGVYIVSAFLVINNAEKRGLNLKRWIFYGVFFHFFALFFLLFKKRKVENKEAIV